MTDNLRNLALALAHAAPEARKDRAREFLAEAWVAGTTVLERQAIIMEAGGPDPIGALAAVMAVSADPGGKGEAFARERRRQIALDRELDAWLAGLHAQEDTAP